MAVFRLDIPPHVAEIIRHLPPNVKQSVKAVLRALSEKSTIGEPLRKDLVGLWKYRVRRFRIVYSIDRRRRSICIMAVGHRRKIYEEVAEQYHRSPLP